MTYVESPHSQFSLSLNCPSITEKEEPQDKRMARQRNKRIVPSEVVLPWEWRPNKVWRITAPFLKLARKYGLLGPWNDLNRSVAFDAYALTRDTKGSLPSLPHLLMTLTMNSRVNGDDVARLAPWLEQ